MKILIVGQFKKWAIENHYARYLCNHAEVFTYAAEDMFDKFYWASKWNKVKFKLGFSSIYQQIATQLEKKVDEVQPDIVLIFKGMRVVPEAISAIKKRGIKVANYNPDHPFLFSTRGSGNKNVTRSISMYDLHLCYSRSVIKRIETEFKLPTGFLPFGYELPEKLYREISREGEIPGACFIGNPDKIRAAHIMALVDNGIPIDVYGHGWNKFLPSSEKIGVHTAVYGDEFWRTMRRYRLQINIFRPHNNGSHNMRTFEVPAAGAIMLAPDSPEHREFFEPGKEIFIYNNKTELVAQAKHILSLTPEEADAIRHNARQRSMDAGYSYEDRARQLYQCLSEIVPAKVASLNA